MPGDETWRSGDRGEKTEGDSVDEYSKPDGGWGWVVTFGVFIVFVITTGSSWAFGILYIAFLDAFGHSKAITAVPGSLIFMMMVVTNPYAGLLADKYGHRPVIFVGGIISSFAIFASSFVDDFVSLTVLYGLIGGIGFGLSHLPAVVMLNHYFDTRIGTATGLAMSGTGLGTIFMSVVTQFLVVEYGWRGTMLVLSAINANLCIAAAVMRPVVKHRQPRVLVETDDDTDDVQVIEITSSWSSNGVDYEEIPQADNSDPCMKITSNPLHQLTSLSPPISKTSSAAHMEIDQLKTRRNSLSKLNNNTSIGATHICSEGNFKNDAHGKEQEIGGHNIRENSPCMCVPRVCKPVWSFFDSVYGFALWKNLMYLSFLMGVNLAFFGFTVVSAHVAKRAMEFGIHEYHSSSLVAVLGLSQAAGRSFTGPIIDRCRLNPMRFYQSMAATCGAAIIASIYLPSYPAQVCFCAVAGYTTGACATLQTVMSGALFGPGQMKFAYSGTILAVGIAMLSSPPIAGLCRDIQGNYMGAFYMAAVACFSSVMALFPLTCTITPGRKLARTQKQDSVGQSQKMPVKV